MNEHCLTTTSPLELQQQPIVETARFNNRCEFGSQCLELLKELLDLLRASAHLVFQHGTTKWHRSQLAIVRRSLETLHCCLDGVPGEKTTTNHGLQRSPRVAVFEVESRSCGPDKP